MSEKHLGVYSWHADTNIPVEPKCSVTNLLASSFCSYPHHTRFSIFFWTLFYTY